MSDEAVQATPLLAPPAPAAPSQIPEDFPLLTSARFVVRECLSSRGIGALAHVVRRIDSFLDTISGLGAVVRACHRGESTRALTYLAARDTESFWERAAAFAATNGHVHVLQWLHEYHPDRCNWTTYTMDGAAMMGNLSTVQWLHENRTEGCTFLAMDQAAGNGYLEVVEWLHANRSEGCSQFAIENAAGSGHLALVQLLHEHYTDVSTGHAIQVAARNGHLAIVQWLYSETGEDGERYRDLAELASANAIANKRLDVAEWLNMQRSKHRRLQ
ncbi:hypothetical protein BBJ28_00009461 [Nothophytophthora sp. Chile5]|nr:hypothetical protein BBJ28_00009461 [Nothophytophthora sp. Chile5]